MRPRVPRHAKRRASLAAPSAALAARRASLVVFALVAALALAACGDDAGNGETAGGEPAGNEPQPTATTPVPKGAAYGGNGQAGGVDRVPTVEVRDGQPVGGVQTLEFSSGETVRFRVRSDVADQIHVHGFDIHADVGPGSPAMVTFPAEFEGIFEVELETRQEPIIELQINP